MKVETSWRTILILVIIGAIQSQAFRVQFGSSEMLRTLKSIRQSGMLLRGGHGEEAHQGGQTWGNEAGHAQNSAEAGQQEPTAYVRFQWPEDEGLQTVEVTGSWDGWSKLHSLQKKDGQFEAVLEVPFGKHTYKFVLDNKIWTCSEASPIQTDESGNQNNYLDITFEEEAAMTSEASSSLASRLANFKVPFTMTELIEKAKAVWPVGLSTAVALLATLGAMSSSNAPLQKYKNLRLWDDNEIGARGPMFTPMTMRMSRGNAAFQSAFGAFENVVERFKRKDNDDDKTKK